LDELLEERGSARFVLWYYSPMAVAWTRHLRPVATVYDCMDELSAFDGAPRTLADREGELLDSADRVFTGGMSLFEAKQRLHPHVHPFPSGVDAAHFARAREAGREPSDQAEIPRPRVGFFGVIDERLDIELLARAASLRPDLHFVMVGPVAKIDDRSLPRGANLHYLGQKSYDELPDYIRGWDVAMLPFAMNEATRFISPTKTPEYLAAGRPVVSTPVRDVVRPYGEQGLVEIAPDAATFVDAIDRARSRDLAQLRRDADALVATMSWDSTWERMRGLIADAIDSNEQAAAVPRRAPARIVDVSVPSGAVPANGDGAAMTNADAGWVPTNGDGRHDTATGPSTRPAVVSSRRRGFDWLIVGAGFAGSVLAERLATQADARVLVVEKRHHIGGNAYDHYDDDGLLIHRYGPHIFHTNAEHVFEYLSRFTQWRSYEHRVLASVDGQLVPIPINLDTINRLYGLNLDAFEVQEFFDRVREPIEHPRTSEDVVVRTVGRELYEKFFRNYTRKQWGMDPSELDASVTARVPTRTTRDDRYFGDTFQAMPAHGYTRMFERMLDHRNIKVLLNTDYREVVDLIPFGEMVYTGPIDEFFRYRFGKLPYRSLDFRFETHDVERYQSAAVVNYPNQHAYTRITEFKYLTGQEHRKTSIVYEYPKAEGDPYYPVPRPENARLYKRYKELADETLGVHFVGRLATYKYYNMDQVVAQALAVFERLAGRSGSRQEGRTDEADKAGISSRRVVGRDRVHPREDRSAPLRSTGT
ncbi:MAG TPA: UDP-galactopyranose mutase, partial [Actinomycetota bacterium]|nr:UDP-galactopyranose mutase [Actinomycetota bacterium]